MTHMAVIMLAKVMIQQYDKTKHVENKFSLFLKRFRDEYTGQNRII